MIGCREIDDYIQQVREGEYPVCQDQLRLCDLVEKAFAEEDIYVDEEQLRKYLSKEKFFPFKLFPWEKFIFALHNCTYWTESGLLRWPDLLMYLGRGAGKNGYISFESFCMITPTNGVDSYDVDVFATSEDQAKTSFKDVYDVLEARSDRMKKFFTWNKEVITNKATRSWFKFNTASPKTKDGQRPGMVIFDEYHAYEDYKLVDVAKTGLGKKQYSRTTIATTDGKVRGGPLDDLKDLVTEILQHGMKDNGLLPFMCHLDDRGEVDDPWMWYKANPSLQYFPTLKQTLEKEYVDYKINPTGNASFMVKRMNMPMTFDKESVADWEKIKACGRALPDLEWCDCVAGIDYAKTTDFVSAGLLFRHKGIYCWMQHTWICKASLDLPKIKAPLDDWRDAGYITMVDGEEIPPELPAEWLAEQAQNYNITYLGIDNFRITLMAKALREAGFDTDRGGANNIRLCKRVTQNRYVPLITSLFNTGKINWGDDPMMSWYTNNACVETFKDNQYYSKKDPERRKTDGFMAMVAAICASEDLIDCGEESSMDDFQVFAF